MSSIEPMELETPRVAFDRSAKYKDPAQSVFGKLKDSNKGITKDRSREGSPAMVDMVKTVQVNQEQSKSIEKSDNMLVNDTKD